MRFKTVEPKAKVHPKTNGNGDSARALMLARVKNYMHKIDGADAFVFQDGVFFANQVMCIYIGENGRGRLLLNGMSRFIAFNA